jgi:hypothetical protein
MKRKLLFVEGMRTKVKLPLKTGLKAVGCPYGTVSIGRVSRNDLARAKILSKIHLSNIDEEPGHR